MSETLTILIPENVNSLFKIFHMPAKREKMQILLIQSWLKRGLVLPQPVSFLSILHIQDKYFLSPECFSFTPKLLALLISR